MSERLSRPPLRTFEHFPPEAICPVCQTTDDGECVLIRIIGTENGHLMEGQPFHLACAVPDYYDPESGLLVRGLRP